MTNAGWYPDPAGAPDTYRYWDGQSWSQMTTTHPSGGADRPASEPTAAPAEPTAMPSQPPVAPQTPSGPEPTAPYATGGYPGQGQQYGQQYGQGQPYGQGQQYGQQYGQVPQQGYGAPGAAPGGYGQPQQWPPAPQQGGGGGGGRTAIIVVAAVLALILLGVGGFFGVRALTGDDDGDTDADPTTSESAETGSDAPSDGGESPGESSTIAPTGIQCTGGSPAPEGLDPAATTLTGGGLTIPLPPGYTPEPGLSEPLAFGTAIQVGYVLVTDNWVSEYAVGGIPRDNGFESLDQTAEIVMQCLTSNDLVYSGFSGRTDLTREAITVGGKDAYRITAEIRVSDPAVTVEGDQTTVIVVDTGDAATYGFYMGVVPLGDDARIAEQEAMIGQIQVG